ncbi:unnamed protein product [Vicia faba]|uniref:Disease resistance N-terminal domain-containing protein n=1 Tax=Vicia faba TaxID=3906 RepID=A0AAV0YYL4_VICFA|nr:unnamed protein product [Vicia faba]
MVGNMASLLKNKEMLCSFSASQEPVLLQPFSASQYNLITQSSYPSTLWRPRLLKQIHDSAVNNWLDDLKDALYLADDILDHISTKAAISKKNKELLGLNTFSNCNIFSVFNILQLTTHPGDLHQPL